MAKKETSVKRKAGRPSVRRAVLKGHKAKLLHISEDTEKAFMKMHQENPKKSVKEFMEETLSERAQNYYLLGT